MFGESFARFFWDDFPPVGGQGFGTSQKLVPIVARRPAAWTWIPRFCAQIGHRRRSSCYALPGGPLLFLRSQTSLVPKVDVPTAKSILGVSDSGTEAEAGVLIQNLHVDILQARCRPQAVLGAAPCSSRLLVSCSAQAHFQRMYGVPTDSINLHWLRRRLLEACGFPQGPELASPKAAPPPPPPPPQPIVITTATGAVLPKFSGAPAALRSGSTPNAKQPGGSAAAQAAAAAGGGGQDLGSRKSTRAPKPKVKSQSRSGRTPVRFAHATPTRAASRSWRSCVRP